ncbi:LacI family transcriptional regulator [Orenia metallireducens]|uniref:LacI family transcriptional regulator n=1 Tax=Orenia metallireducens TaxID=1413210 RepID=A0A1C0A6J5_9FIRM|nr:LacI family DNA-binding transcriptional regulator [Orenia metallireducens]OCL25739.1 LacI family transcriptional regulator [Orenia metallireducens]
MSKVTIYDVAKVAGVGVGTVSRVLNASDNVSDKTRQKVLKVMEELNYRPNAMARGLALQKTNSIGIMVPNFVGHFFVEVLQGVQKALDFHNMDLVLFKVDKKYKEKYIESVIDAQRVDGVLGITLDMTEEEVAKFQDAKLPLVLVDDFREEVSSIAVDDIAGSKKAIEYLLDLGHRKIAFLDGPLGSIHGFKRLKGVELAFKEAGLKFDHNLLKTGDFNMESGYNLMKEILELNSDEIPTAIFAASDNQAIGALKAIEDAGLKVPEDFALIGYDDIELAKYLNLTTISQPMTKMGKMGIDILIGEISSDKKELTHRVIEPELVIRKSC